MLFFPSQNVSLLGSGCTTVRLVRHFNGRGRMVLCAAELRGKPSKIVQLARQPTQPRPGSRVQVSGSQANLRKFGAHEYFTFCLKILQLALNPHKEFKVKTMLKKIQMGWH